MMGNPSFRELKKEKDHTRKPDEKRPKVTTWWLRSGALLSPQIPSWCAKSSQQTTKTQCKTPVGVLCYDLAHELLMEMRRARDGAGAAPRAAHAREQQFMDFFANCRDGDKRGRLPFPDSLDGQRGVHGFKPHQCVRQLALIELSDAKYADLPLDHAALLERVSEIRRQAGEAASRDLSSEKVEEMAAERLFSYSKDADRGHSNARFLDLRLPPGEKRTTRNDKAHGCEPCLQTWPRTRVFRKKAATEWFPGFPAPPSVYIERWPCARPALATAPFPPPAPQYTGGAGATWCTNLSFRVALIFPCAVIGPRLYLHIADPKPYTQVATETDAHAAVRRLVNRLVEQFQQQKIDVCDFAPNQLATIAVYYAKFLRPDKKRAASALSRWCYPLKQYVPGADIESNPRALLASEYLPRHYDDSDSPDQATTGHAGTAIATAPVVCELCGRGFAGEDDWAAHCRATAL